MNPPARVAAVNMTAVDATATTYLTAWEPGHSRPAVTNLSVSAGKIVANAQLLALGTSEVGDAVLNVYNHRGSISILVDTAGRFDEYTVPNSSSGG